MRPVLIPALILVLFALLGASTPCFAAESLHYEIYAGGIHALSADLSIVNNPKNYTVRFHAKPYGVIGNLLPWGGVYETKGHKLKDEFYPDNFNKTSQWREDNDTDMFVYKKGTLISQTERDETKKPVVTKNIPIDPVLTANAVDILTGTVRLMRSSNIKNSCDFSTIIYDGRRRYTLQFRDKGKENLTASQYNSYNGEAKICEIEMIPIAGFPKKPKGYYKIQEEARIRGQLPRVWLGKVHDAYVPVKILVKSEMGAVLIHWQKTSP
jgi:hypothetical protein